MDTGDSQDITETLAGDERAYRRLVERYQEMIGVQMRRFSRNVAVRQELTQEVFVEAYFSLRTFRNSAPFLHWLRRIAIRVGYRYWTQNTRREEISLSEDDWNKLQGKFPMPGDAEETAEIVHALLAKLPPTDRLILTLIYLDGCSLAEAADRAGWTLTGAKVNAFRARNRLRKLLGGRLP